MPVGGCRNARIITLVDKGSGLKPKVDKRGVGGGTSALVIPEMTETLDTGEQVGHIIHAAVVGPGAHGELAGIRLGVVPGAR